MFCKMSERRESSLHYNRVEFTRGAAQRRVECYDPSVMDAVLSVAVQPKNNADQEKLARDPAKR
jgi:hypothetical protein